MKGNDLNQWLMFPVWRFGNQTSILRKAKHFTAFKTNCFYSSNKCVLTGQVYEIDRTVLNFKKTYHLHPAMRLLRNALQKERNIKLVLAIVLMSAGVTVPYLYFQKNSFISSAGMVALIIGIRLMYGLLKRPRTEDERLWNLLNENPRQIVWVYSISTQTMPFGFHLWDAGTMYFKLADGDEVSVNLPVRKLKMVSKFLNRLLPHASFGYSDERQAMFKNDPTSLLK